MNPYASGYNELTAKKLKNISIPDRIKCSVCKKSKANGQYSAKQLNDLRSKIFRFGQASIPSEGAIKCSLCTGQQRTEMECSRCERVKGLDKFSLAQRRKGDQAVCMICQEDVDWTAADDRDFTTGHDDAISYATDDDSTDTLSQVYEMDEYGDYATASTISGSSRHTSVSDGGVALPSASSGSYTLGTRKTLNGYDIKTSSLTRQNLEQLSGLMITDPSSEQSSSVLQSSCFEQTCGPHISSPEAWKSFARDPSGHTQSTSGGEAVWVKQESAGDNKGKAKDMPRDEHVWAGQRTYNDEKFYTAYDPTGKPHLRKQSVSTTSNLITDVDSDDDCFIERKPKEKFPRVRPTPRIRPAKLDIGNEEEERMRVAGMDDSDDDSDEEYF